MKNSRHWLLGSMGEVRDMLSGRSSAHDAGTVFTIRSDDFKNA